MRAHLSLVVLLAAAFVAPGIALAQVPDADLAMAKKVTARVQEYPHFSIFDDVSIEVTNGAVTLTGRVTMPDKRREIGERVAKIDGVRTLANNLQVLPVSQYDSDLRVRIAQAIYGHAAFWQYAAMACPPIHILVEGGHVALIGHVSSEVERTLAFALAQVPGTFSVKNQLKVDRE
jgi:osmotically-inducible protein OsmY